jgi:NADPH:quinone reductase-like Zn-dependent oxidoreductase
MRNIYARNIKLVGSYLFHYFTSKEVAQGCWKQMFDLIEEGKLKQTIYKTYAFENTPEAFADIAGGQTIGKLLIKLD